MENIDFDRSDFNEVLGYLERLRQEVGKVQDKTDSFCTSFHSGLGKVSRGLTKIKLTGLSNDMVKLQQNALLLNKWISKTGTQFTDIGVANAEAAISELATMSEMTYNVFRSIASLNKLQDLKISTDADKNREALEAIVGSGERMKQLFDELQANPLLKNMGLEKDVFAKLRSRWEVLQNGKEDIVGMMTTYGKGRNEVNAFVKGWQTIQKTENRSLKGFGTAMKAIFKKKEKQPVEEGQKRGFFSIFRKKDKGDKNWFTAVGHRFNEFKDRTKADMAERFTPLVDYATRVTAAYAPLQDMTGNVLNVVKLGQDFKGQAHLAWLNTASGWGIGNKEQNLADKMKLRKSGEKRNTKWLERQGKLEDWSGKIRETVGKMNTGIGKQPQVPPELLPLNHSFLKESMSPPEIVPIISDKPGWKDTEKAVTVQVERLVENLTITPANLTEGVDTMRQIVVDELQRILNNVNNWACETNLK